MLVCSAVQSLWFVVVYKRRFAMSWGPATVFIHRKVGWSLGGNGLFVFFF